MIPKIIHYCWFGRGKKSKLINKCIKSWKKFLPDYEIIEWNEDNFDINSVPWTKQAYKDKKWAFVSDYVRLYALKNYGGIYLDTDVEVTKPLDEFLQHQAFSGFESAVFVPTGIIAAENNQSVINDWLSYYDNRNYIVDGQVCMDSNVIFMTEQLVEKGLVLNNEFQVVDGMALYPRTYFCPVGMLDVSGDCISEHTHTIHHFASSWRSKKTIKDMKRVKRHSTKWYRTLEKIRWMPNKIIRKAFGDDSIDKLKKKLGK